MNVRNGKRPAKCRDRVDSRASTTLSAVVREICRHPTRHLIRHWNWKAALISLACRGALFFSVNATASWGSAVHALSTELIYRAPMVGTLAAVSQSFRTAQPAWAATIVVAAVIPAIAHGVEFGMHWWRGTERLAESVAASVAFSALTAGTTHLLQRRGVLVVGADAKPFRTDLLLVPRFLLEILARRPNSIRTGLGRVTKTHLPETSDRL